AVVEDKPAYRRSLSAVFELTAGIDCVGSYASAEEGLREIPKLAVQVVLMDLSLPGRSGVDCTRDLRALIPQLQVIVLTIAEESSTVFAALRAGATGYLMKTASPVEIIEAIQLVARGGSPMSAIIARRVVESFHGLAEPSGAREELSPREIEVLEGIAQ